MAKIPEMWGDIPVNPTVKPEHGVWMEIDPAKYVERRGRPGKNDPRYRPTPNYKARVAELEGAIDEIWELVTNNRVKLVTNREIIGKICRILSKVSD